MTKDELKKIVDKHTTCASDYEAIWRAVEAYSSASNDGKPIVSGSLPPSPYIELGVEAREYAKKIGELENGIVELSFYNGGVFVINEWLGGNDR